MKTFKHQAAQGDCWIRRVQSIPASALKTERKPGEPAIVAHSETGHHHAILNDSVSLFEMPDNPLICYLQVDGDYADLLHHRSFSTHDGIRFTTGCYQITRAREYTPAGWRRVQD
jgi:hypothetical protein